MNVHEIVRPLLAEGRLSHQEIADEVRRHLPHAATTAKSVASQAVEWRRRNGGSRPIPAGAEARAEMSRSTAARAVVPAPQPPPTLSQVGEVIAQAKAVARAYRALTGRPLGVTGEVGEYEAALRLGLSLAPVRTEGYDAVDGEGRRFQIKSRSFGAQAKRNQQTGGLKLAGSWDAVLLVLLDEHLAPREIWRAERAPVEAALTAPGSIARNKRGALAVSKFKAIGRRVWSCAAGDGHLGVSLLAERGLPEGGVASESL